jgi:hypothetical protein
VLFSAISVIQQAQAVVLTKASSRHVVPSGGYRSWINRWVSGGGWVNINE